ncbi:MAG: YndJ family transporter [Opitutaceae bacterium]
MTTRLRVILGSVAAIAFAIVQVRDLRAEMWSHALLAFAALVLVPLMFQLWREEGESTAVRRLFAVTERLQLPAALLLAGACALPRGTVAGIFAAPWTALTVLLAASGALRLKADGIRRPLPGLCADASLMFGAVGGAWTLADRIGFRPLGFDFAIVGLTAVHFHYAGLLLPTFAGLVQRELWLSRLAARAAVGVILGVPAVALGITASQLGWAPAFEAAAGCGLALAGAIVAILHVRLATELRATIFARVLLGIAGVSLFFGMVLAALYAIRTHAMPFPWLQLPQMRMLHGTVNALGFGLCGALAWRRVANQRQEN